MGEAGAQGVGRVLVLESQAGAGHHHPRALPEQEKEHLEERLLQTTRTLQEVEAELQNLQKSCLLQLARSSWVGRMLRSQTGSVEVSLSPKPSCPRLPSSALPLSSGASAGVPWPAWKPALLRLPLELWAPAGRNQEASKHR